jgi:hypothetical protein
MTDKKHAITINGVFNGIYEWGQGFKDRNIADKWNRYWKVEFPKNKDGFGKLFWKYADGDDFGGCGHLSCIGGNIYMHPMNFTTTLIANGGARISHIDGKDYYNHFSNELRELKEICDECAEFCGGSFQLYISPEFEIEVTRPTIEFSEDLDIKEFGEEVKEGSYIY